MTNHSCKTAFLFASLLAIVALPIASALAESSQNAATNTAVGNRSTVQGDGSFHSLKNGISDYDGFDRFRDSTGRPLPGWEYLFNVPG